jgi:hypothetical protein
MAISHPATTCAWRPGGQERQHRASEARAVGHQVEGEQPDGEELEQHPDSRDPEIEGVGRQVGGQLLHVLALELGHQVVGVDLEVESLVDLALEPFDALGQVLDELRHLGEQRAPQHDQERHERGESAEHDDARGQASPDATARQPVDGWLERERQEERDDEDQQQRREASDHPPHHDQAGEGGDGEQDGPRDPRGHLLALRCLLSHVQTFARCTGPIADGRRLHRLRL